MNKTIICKQLFAGQILGSRPMERKEYHDNSWSDKLSKCLILISYDRIRNLSNTSACSRGMLQFCIAAVNFFNIFYCEQRKDTLFFGL